LLPILLVLPQTKGNYGNKSNAHGIRMPPPLPLDLRAELHLRSDRTSIAYRKWLSELGLTFGTA
jgi:hypothetical protein